MPTLDRITIYPVKSLDGVDVESARVLPSGAGRTTMCPGELFFDVRENQSYLRLLPIETRLSELGVTSYRRMPDAWTTLPLDTGKPESLRKAFGELAATKVGAAPKNQLQAWIEQSI